MNWRRGFLLAGTHFVVAAALIGWDLNREWHSRTQASTAVLTLAAWQEEESQVPFDPCHGKGYADYSYSPEERIVQIDNLPAWTLTGWKISCPSPWTVAGALEGDSNHFSFHKYLFVSATLCALVPVQWFLVGAFPLVKSGRRFLEPGALITTCTVALAVLILLTRMLPIADVVDVISTFVLAFELLIWLYWCGLLIWKGLHGGFQFFPRRSAASNQEMKQ